MWIKKSLEKTISHHSAVDGINSLFKLQGLTFSGVLQRPLFPDQNAIVSGLLQRGKILNNLSPVKESNLKIGKILSVSFTVNAKKESGSLLYVSHFD